MDRKFYRKVLKNGMTIVFEKRDLPVVSVGFAVRYGGINESLSERGIAHFIEHMLYKGTRKRTSKQISQQIEKNGGVLNGFTEEQITAFWCKMPSDKLRIALDVLSDMVKNPLLDAKEMEKERKVIFEEMKIYHDSPSHYVFDKIQSFLYEKPLGAPLIGTHESMNSIDRKKMLKKFKGVYKPGNMILGVVGDADFSDLIKFAEKNFGKEKAKVKKQKITSKNGSGIEKRKGIDQANLVLAFHSPLSTDKKVYAAKVLIALLAHGMSSRLFREVRDKRNLAYSIFGDVNANKYFSYSYIYAGAMKENIEKIKKIILDEFKKISKKLPQKEFDDTKNQLIGNYRISMENSESQMNQLILSEIDGKVEEFYEFEKNIRAVKLKDVRKLAKIKKYSFFALVPE
ncbi:MAG: pitrilysin family protein [Nanoarchaeota archaeon]|nr:pitrilysin family protein [Nanoarchaeota archaeon]